MFSHIKRVISQFIELNSKSYFILLILATVLIAGFGVIEPFFMAKVMEFLETYLKTGFMDMQGFGLLMLFWGGYIILSLGFSFIHRYYLSDLPALKFHNQVAFKYVEKIYTMSLGAYLSKKSGSIFKNFDRGTGSHFQIIFFFFKDAVKTLTSLLIILIIMLFVDPTMTLIALSMVPFMALTGWYVDSRTREPQRKNEERWTSAYGHISDFLSGMMLGKILRLEKDFMKRFYSELDEALIYQKYTSKWWSISDMVTSIFVMISRLLVLGYGVYMISQGSMSLANLMLFFGYIGFIYFPISFLFGSYANLQKWATDIEKFYEEFDVIEKEEDTDNSKEIVKVEGNIHFNNVTFGYTDDRTILNNFSLHIKKGERIALVGSTGAGKSTIISLLFRFWNVQSGSICLDNTNIQTISRKSLRTHFGLVAQDSSLFNLSIRDNLRFSKPDGTDEEIKKALEHASATFVYELPEGLDTMIGERGLKLSGGEKQRISIARLFLQNPEIIVLDEATSALDNTTEKEIQKSLERLMKNRTSIIIAHRLSTIKHVDRICMLENGTIVESGSYDELMKKGGKFAKLADPDKLIIN